MAGIRIINAMDLIEHYSIELFNLGPSGLLSSHSMNELRHDLDLDISRNFRIRVTKVKEDLTIRSGYVYKISGLLENGKWSFVCSEHKAARFESEEGLRKHFQRARHHHPRYN
jgi:hypothetical protein